MYQNILSESSPKGQETMDFMILHQRMCTIERTNFMMCEAIGGLVREMEDLRARNIILEKMSRSQGALIIQRCWRKHLLIRRTKTFSKYYRISHPNTTSSSIPPSVSVVNTLMSKIKLL
jgi:hypothetical protein